MRSLGWSIHKESYNKTHHYATTIFNFTKIKLATRLYNLMIGRVKSLEMFEYSIPQYKLIVMYCYSTYHRVNVCERPSTQLANFSWTCVWLWLSRVIPAVILVFQRTCTDTNCFNLIDRLQWIGSRYESSGYAFINE